MLGTPAHAELKLSAGFSTFVIRGLALLIKTPHAVLIYCPHPFGSLCDNWAGERV
jgi:hypothetical protein